MLLRIEDTDQTRFVKGAEDYIYESLRWIGITIDEGVAEGGPHAPYRQSERKPLYMQYAIQLIEAGHAYYAFDTTEDLDAMRDRLKNAGVASPQYNSITRTQMRNSLTLPEEEVKALLEAKTPYVIRLKVPRKEEVRLNDMIRGWVMVHSSAIDDKVLMKSDGMPTYHLANVVDDHIMEISHVIRGEEWLPSAPLHVLLYKYLGWEDTMPRFAHLPLLLKPDGNGKLSKRDAEMHGFPVFPLKWTDPESGNVVMSFKEEGYLPDAMLNFLAFLGWNPGTQQELFNMDELIEAFTVERIGKSGTKFDIHKAQWFNQQYLRKRSDADLAAFLLADLTKLRIACTAEKAEAICALLKERATFPHDLVKDAECFFNDPTEYDEAVIQSKWTTEAIHIITLYKSALANLEIVDAVSAKATLVAVLEKEGVKIGKVMQALRVAVTGLGAGPDLMMIIEIIGKDATLNRLEKAIANISIKV